MLFYSDVKYIRHLRKYFERCRKFGISLNPKKSLFAMREGRLLRHIISKEGVIIDPKRFSTILVISLPKNKKEIQSFLGKIMFLRRLIPNYDEIVKDITNILKKDNDFKVNIQVRYSFSHIKKGNFRSPSASQSKLYKKN